MGLEELHPGLCGIELQHQHGRENHSGHGRQGGGGAYQARRLGRQEQDHAGAQERQEKQDSQHSGKTRGGDDNPFAVRDGDTEDSR